MNLKRAPSSFTNSHSNSSSNEPYTMDSYVEHVKTNYISGDASVLMFGATASRQVGQHTQHTTHNTPVYQFILKSQMR